MVLCTTFDYGIDTKKIGGNPIERIKQNELKFTKRHRLKKREAETPKVYTMEQIEELGRVMQKQPLKWRVYYSILIETGIRRGECCALRWKNVDFDKGRLCIDQSCNYTPDKGIFFDSPKNGKTRIVLISPETIDLMKELRKSQEKCPSEFVFTRRNSSDVMSPNVATEYFHELEVKHSLSFHCNPHKFRHTFASLAATNNTSPVTLSALLGHTDQRSSRRYTHPYTEAEEAAAKGVMEIVERRFPLITKSEESLAKKL